MKILALCKKCKLKRESQNTSKLLKLHQFSEDFILCDHVYLFGDKK